MGLKGTVVATVCGECDLLLRTEAGQRRGERRLGCGCDDIDAGAIEADENVEAIRPLQRLGTLALPMGALPGGTIFRKVGGRNR